MIKLNKQNQFPLGQVVATPAILESIHPDAIICGLMRHASGDWGNIDVNDRQLNDNALTNGNRILSVYGEEADCFWIITEADRSVTTILLPYEY